MKTAISKTNKSKSQAKAQSKSKKSTRKKVDSTLSICPVNGAGWCPYPFSAAQLKKRMKRIQEEQEEEEKEKQLLAGKDS